MDILYGLGMTPLIIFAVLVSLLFISIIISIVTRYDLMRLREDYAALMDYLGNSESRDILGELTALIRSIEADYRAHGEELEILRAAVAGCVQKAAVVRYNAFQGSGSDLSYSVALLDSNDDGVVLSGIYGRESSTSYAKPIRGGASDYVLTREEAGAIAIARRQYIGRSYYSGAAGDGG